MGDQGERGDGLGSAHAVNLDALGLAVVDIGVGAVGAGGALGLLDARRRCLLGGIGVVRPSKAYVAKWCERRRWSVCGDVAETWMLVSCMRTWRRRGGGRAVRNVRHGVCNRAYTVASVEGQLNKSAAGIPRGSQPGPSASATGGAVWPASQHWHEVMVPGRRPCHALRRALWQLVLARGTLGSSIKGVQCAAAALGPCAA